MVSRRQLGLFVLTVCALASMGVLVGFFRGASDVASPASLPELSLDGVLGVEMTEFEFRESIFEEEVEAQELIAACMRRQGFEYDPFVDEGLRPQSSLQLSVLEQAELLGFGMTIDPRFELGDDPRPFVIDFRTDPNLEIFESLGPEQQQAYQRALFAKTAEGVGEGGILFDSTTGTEGCEAEAFAALTPPDPASNAEISEYFRLLDELEEELKADANVANAERQSIECLSTAGFEVEDLGPSVPNLVMKFALATVPDADGDAVSLAALAHENRELIPNIRRIQDFERELAVAFVTCTRDLGKVEDEVREVLEQKLVEEHFDLLAAVAPSIRRRPSGR